MVSGIEAVFLANKDALLRFLRARGGGEEAEDLLQEVWIKLSAMPGAPVADPLAYLYRMANNLMLDRRRTEHRRLRRERDWSDAASASTILAQEAADGERLLLEVEDNGVGIAPEHQWRVFTQGFTTKKQGHGFGLHSSALAASEMGGQLSCSSPGPGHGATFTLALPPRPPGSSGPA